MPRIPDACTSVLKEAANTVLDNFTPKELAEFEVAALRLGRIIQRAKDRQQESLNKTA
jgi:hypothetical protein